MRRKQLSMVQKASVYFELNFCTWSETLRLLNKNNSKFIGMFYLLWVNAQS